ncbi:MAG TPA: FtsX-like permease family protein [Polyangia bacterium]|jgi:ABC-type lipoprotein release transport system permease subunit|nr:FtsX-like permease family protein [Polyangia bacterium]
MSSRRITGWIDTFGVVAQIAFRNLFASRLKTIIVGGIIFFGALLVVAGNSLLDSLDASMSRSVIGSVAGHIQVYSAQSKDPLEVMGSMTMGDADLAPLDDFARVRQTLLSVPNVKSVVPMGISGALVTSGNTIDVALDKLRGLYRKKLAGGLTADAQGKLSAQIDAEKGHIRQIVSVLQGDLKNLKAVIDVKAINQEDADAVNHAASDDFWAKFDKDPLASLEFLENRIATQAADADLLFIRYVGTDLDSFGKAFDRMQIVDGTAVPPGKRGFLFSKFVYEDQLKLKSAHRLDQIKDARDARGSKIAKDLDLQRMVRENVAQVREVLLQLDAIKTADFRAKLQKELGSPLADVGALLAAFFETDDRNFDARYAFFYRELAPSLELYRIRIGDTLTIKSFTRSGYVQSVNLHVYGTFQFQGLEKSTLAGGLSLMDLVSFRELYGFLTDEKRAEIEQLQKAAGARSVSRENAEAELFGAAPDTQAAEPVKDRKARGKKVSAHAAAHVAPDVASDLASGMASDVAPAIPDLTAGLGQRLRRENLVDRAYAPGETESGVVLNAAVILNDPKKIPQTIAAIEAAGVRSGLPLKAISWQKASGIIGQFIMLARIVLYVAILIIFVIALVIINNAMVMATLERVQEIGTLRAIGAQRRFILAMLVIESLVVGVIFGAIGAGVGALLVSIVGKIGIPARSDVWFFFFSGPRLHPFLGTTNLVVAFLAVMLVSAFSSFYPAWLAMRVTPRQAMQSEE